MKTQKPTRSVSYQRGKEIRSTRLSNLIVDKLENKSILGAVGSSISEKLSARSMATKEKFDPLNVIRFMTGGSKLATGVAGKLMGRSQQDIDYFTGRKGGAGRASRMAFEAPSPIKSMNGSVEQLSNIYNFLKNTREEKKKELETMRDFEVSKSNEEERQHNEVINVFNKAMGKKNRKQKDLSSMKMDFNKVFKKKSKKFTEKVEAPKTEDDEKGFLDGLNKKLALIAIGGLAVGGAVYATTKKEDVAESAPAPSASKMPTERVSNIENEPIKKQIRAREGGGQTPYSVINRTPGEGSSYIVKSGNVDITTKTPYTKNLEDMSIGEVNDLQRRRSKFFGKKGMGAAAGAYGFMPDTLAGLAKNKYGDKWREVPFSKDVQDGLADELLAIIKQNIKKANLPISEAMIYSMWFFGQNDPNTAYKLVYSADGNTTLENILRPEAITANPQLKGKTVDWYRNNVITKGKNKLSTIPLEGTVPGDVLDNKQKENSKMKGDLTSEKHSSLMINRIIQPSIQNNYNTNILPVFEPHPVLG